MEIKNSVDVSVEETEDEGLYSVDFILDNKKGKGKLRPEAFKNLIGRVCRFSEIFNPSTGGLEMLEQRQD